MASDNVIELVVKVIDEATKELEQVTATISGLAKVAASFGVAFSLKKVIDETIEAERSSFLLANAVKAVGLEGTGAAADLAEFADELQRTTIFADNSAKAVEAMGLRLGLTVDVVKQATVAAANLAAANPGQSLEEAGAVITRALADPLRALQNLRREHVVFSQQEQFTIETLARTGQAAQAQARILELLRNSYRDAAKDAQQTLGGALEHLGNSFTSLLGVGAGQSSDAVRFINDLASGLDTLKNALTGTLAPQREVSDGMKVFATVLLTVYEAVRVFASSVYNTLGGAFKAVGSIVGGIGAAIQQAWNFKDQNAGAKVKQILKDAFSDAGSAISDGVNATRATLDDAAAQLDDHVAKLWNDVARTSQKGIEGVFKPPPKDTFSIEQLRALREATLAIQGDIDKFAVQATAPFDELQQQLYETALRANLAKLGIHELTPALQELLNTLKGARADATRQDVITQLSQQSHELALQAELGNQAADAIAQYRAELQLAAGGAHDLDDQIKNLVDRNNELKNNVVIKNLQDQLALEQLVTKEKEKQQALLQLGKNATQEDKDKVKALIDQIQLVRDQTSAVQSLQDAFKTMFEHVGDGLGGMLQAFANAFKQILAQAIALDLVKALGLDKLSGKNADGSNSSSVLGAVFNGLFSAFGKHAGGGTDDRPFWAGESGPELIVPGGTTSILNTRQLAFAGGGAGVNYAPTYQVSIVANDADKTKAELVRFIAIQSQRDREELYHKLMRNGVGPRRGLR